MSQVHSHHPHHVHWTLAVILALLVLLVSGLSWNWIAAGGLERRPAGTELNAPSLPEFKLPSAPRPTG